MDQIFCNFGFVNSKAIYDFENVTVSKCKVNFLSINRFDD